MPISRSGKLYYTKEQYERARYESSALEYAQQHGYDLVSEGGRYYHLREHDSMIFTQNGRWFWNSHALQGGAIEFLVYYEGRTLPEAVNLLAPLQRERMNVQDRSADENRPRGQPPSEREAIPPQPFVLPARDSQENQLYAYLCKTRRLHRAVVHDLVQQGRLFQSSHTYTGRDGAQHRVANAVFVSYAPDGEPSGAFQRGLSSHAETAYKRDVPGSSKEHAFLIPSKIPAHSVAVFEAAIDAASHASIAMMERGEYADGVDRIALGGIVPTTVLNYLEAHSDVKTIWLCLDNDAAGKKGVGLIREALEENGYSEQNGYTIAEWLPVIGKDWNDQLVEVTRIKESLARSSGEQTAAQPVEEIQAEL